MVELDPLLAIARDLTASLTADDRYRRLLEKVREVVPCDAAALLRVDGQTLVPLAAHGLAPEAMGRRYERRDHPRLDIICASDVPVRFPIDTDLPDPFDGMLLEDRHALRRIHACLGCPLRVEGELIGVLTADALEPRAFEALDQLRLSTLGALAAAALRTSNLIEALEASARHLGLVAKDLARDAREARGGELIGSSASMRRLRDEIRLVARSGLPILISGETGTGKELTARAVHEASDRRDHPMIYVNCAALPESMAESELFGHKRGAFTGAAADRPGKFEVANGGTLFLDEIGELPLALQPKLLRALQEGEIQRVGSDQPHRVDVRLLTATNRDLEREVREGRFRADLYHRLNVYRLRVPPLREHKDDIAELAGYFLDAESRRLGTNGARLSAEARRALELCPWPGNIRELHNVLSRALLKRAGTARRGEPLVVESDHLGAEIASGAAAGPVVEALADAPPIAADLAFRDAVDEFQRRLVRDAVARADGNWAAAARALGLDRSNLHHLAKRLGLGGGRSR